MRQAGPSCASYCNPALNHADALGVSRKFVYTQSLRASTALTEAFSMAANDEEKVLFELVVTP